MVIMMISGDDCNGSRCHHNDYFSREAISSVCERRGVDVEAIVVFLEQNKVLPKKEDFPCFDFSFSENLCLNVPSEDN